MHYDSFHRNIILTLRTFAPKSSHAQIFFKLATQKDYDILLPKRQKKLGVTDLVLERTCLEKYPKSEKSASLADKATVSVSPTILLSDLLNEMFSAKYCFSGPIK